MLSAPLVLPKKRKREIKLAFRLLKLNLLDDSWPKNIKILKKISENNKISFKPSRISQENIKTNNKTKKIIITN